MGYRVLLMGIRLLSEDEYSNIMKMNEKDKVNAVEKHITVFGASAIED